MKSDTKTDRRTAYRKTIEGIEVQDLTSISNYAVIARIGRIINASTSGFLLEVNRKDIVAGALRGNLTLESMLGQHVALYLPQMNLDLDGTVTRATHMGKGIFAIGVDFSYDVPEYWRACLIDLLPAPGELEETEEIHEE